MKKSLIFIFYIMLAFSARLIAADVNTEPDSNTVIKLNKQGFMMRLTNPQQMVANAAKALAIAQKIEYKEGIGESYRMMGLGTYYLDQPKKAIDYYLIAIKF